MQVAGGTKGAEITTIDRLARYATNALGNMALSSAELARVSRA